MLVGLLFVLSFGGSHGGGSHGGEGHGGDDRGNDYDDGYYGVTSHDSVVSNSGVFAGPLHWNHLWPLLPFWALGALVLWQLIRKNRR